MVGHRRLVADRFRRIWNVVEEIAERPGQSRSKLADRFHLSERQTQADLNVIRDQMGLPLVRHQGYRFEDLGGPRGGAMTAREAQLMVLTLDRAARARLVSREEIGPVLVKLGSVAPPHIRPLIASTIEAMQGAHSEALRRFLALADAMLTGGTVRVTWAPGSEPDVIGRPSVVGRPDVLLPWLGHWFVLGRWHVDGAERSRMFALDAVGTVTAVLAGSRAS